MDVETDFRILEDSQKHGVRKRMNIKKTTIDKLRQFLVNCNNSEAAQLIQELGGFKPQQLKEMAREEYEKHRTKILKPTSLYLFQGTNLQQKSLRDNYRKLVRVIDSEPRFIEGLKGVQAYWPVSLIGDWVNMCGAESFFVAGSLFCWNGSKEQRLDDTTKYEPDAAAQRIAEIWKPYQEAIGVSPDQIKDLYSSTVNTLMNTGFANVVYDDDDDDPDDEYDEEDDEDDDCDDDIPRRV